MESVEVRRRTRSYAFSCRRAERWGMSKGTSDSNLH